MARTYTVQKDTEQKRLQGRVWRESNIAARNALQVILQQVQECDTLENAARMIRIEWRAAKMRIEAFKKSSYYSAHMLENERVKASVWKKWFTRFIEEA